jgi:hypothetical protein
LTETDWIKRLREEGEDVAEPVDDDEPVVSTDRPSNITQHTLLSYIVGNIDMWTIMEPIIKPDYFDEQYKPVVALLIEHTREYKQIPSNAIILMKTGVTLETYEDAQDERTGEWLLDEIQTFCRHRATEIEIKRASLAIQKDASRATLDQIFQNFKLITEISLEKDLGIEVHNDARTVLNLKEEEIIKPTGYKHIDHICKGFPSPGLVMFAGTSGLGKSVTLANFGVNYAEQGEFVIYISLELPEKRIFQRVCSMMTNIPIREIYYKKDAAADAMERRIAVGTDGLFIIKKMGMSGTTTAHIAAYLKEITIKIGRKPRVMCLDYLDLLHPRAQIRDLGNIHVKDKYVAEETYGLCEDWNLLGLTASQMVKNNAEMDAFDHASVAGGTPKMNIMDYSFALQRKDEELIMRVLKGRYGGEGVQIPMLWDINTLRISDKSDEEFFALNPRLNPTYQRDQAGKTAILQKTAVNKDASKVRTDNVLDRIKNMDSGFGDF